MKKHIAEDLPARKHPQAQLSQSNKPERKDSGRDGDDKGGEKTPEQRIRQAVYDIRYRARRENIPLRSAYSQYMQNSSMGEQEKAEVRAKLFGKEGGGMQAEDFTNYIKDSASNAVSKALSKVFLEKKEEVIDENQLKYGLEEKVNDTSEGKKYKVRVTDRKSNVTYVRYATRQKISELRAKGLEVEMTEYGTPYEGERTKGEKTSEVLGGGKKPNDGNLGNNYPPYDKVTRGDVIAGARGEDRMGGKRKIKEEFIGEVSATANLPQVDASQQVNPIANSTQIDFTTKKNKIVVNPSDNSQNKLMSHHEMEGDVILETGYSKFLKKVHSLQEKAESEQQQKLFGLALSVKRGQTPRSEVSAEVLKIVDEMSEKEIRKFAKTKHEGLPKIVKETSCGSEKENKVDRRSLETEINLAKNKVRSMGIKNPIVMVASEETVEEGLGLSVGASKVLGKVFSNKRTSETEATKSAQKNITDPVGFAIKGALKGNGSDEMLQKRRPQTGLQKRVATKTQQVVNQSYEIDGNVILERDDEPGEGSPQKYGDMRNLDRSDPKPPKPGTGGDFQPGGKYGPKRLPLAKSTKTSQSKTA